MKNHTRIQEQITFVNHLHSGAKLFILNILVTASITIVATLTIASFVQDVYYVGLDQVHIGRYVEASNHGLYSTACI